MGRLELLGQTSQHVYTFRFTTLPLLATPHEVLLLYTHATAQRGRFQQNNSPTKLMCHCCMREGGAGQDN